MHFIPIKTRIFHPPKDNIFDLIDQHVPPLIENDILIITSKIVAIHQGRCVKKTEKINKDDLIKQEADSYIPRELSPHGHALLTIKQHTLIPSAGIDESNADGYFILWPEKINETAKEICQYVKQKHGITNLAVIITDSHCVPLRRGVVGISIGFYGLVPLKDYRGTKDIFGREMLISQSNIVDSLAAMSGLLMGEGAEKTPMMIIRGADFVHFTEHDTYQQNIIEQEEDIFKPLLDVFEGEKSQSP